MLQQRILQRGDSLSITCIRAPLFAGRETTYKICSIELTDMALEMEPLAQPAELFGYILGIARFRPIQDQDASLLARHGDKGRMNCRTPIGCVAAAMCARKERV